jgi:hypothetical protein
MTIQNRIIKEAKAKPEYISVRLCDVRKIAKHATHSVGCYGVPLLEIEKKLLDGEVRILGVPIRVGS